MNDIQRAGIKKRSFELNYNGGTIWCEHLDSMGEYEDEVIAKFTADIKTFSRPSVSSFMIIDLDETDITEHIAETIVNGISDTAKVFRKIAFVGVDRCWYRVFRSIEKKGIVVAFISDYEKAKEWLYTR